MPKKDLAKLQSIIDFPAWVFSRGKASIYCDKITETPSGLTRKRYLVTAGSQCTCMSFMKVGSCKHLSMLKSDYAWTKSSVSGEQAAEEARELVKKVKPEFPTSDSWSDWPDAHDPGLTAPESVASLEFTAPKSEGPKGVERVVFLRRVGNAKLAVAFIFKDSQLISR
jgi:hypothetical protein